MNTGSCSPILGMWIFPYFPEMAMTFPPFTLIVAVPLSASVSFF